MGRLAASLSLAACLVTPGHAAYLDGQTISGYWVYPNAGSSIWGPITVTVGAGPEITIPDRGFVDVSDQSFLIQFNFAQIPNWEPASFNGFKIVLPANLPALTGVSFGAATTPAYLAGAKLSFTDHSFSVNWAGLPIGTNAVQVNLMTAVPEPEVWALLLGGLGLLGGTQARRKKSAP
jgi:hypothetical protein